MNYNDLVANYDENSVYIMKFEYQPDIFLQINKIELFDKEKCVVNDLDDTLFGSIYYKGHKYPIIAKMFYNPEIDDDYTVSIFLIFADWRNKTTLHNLNDFDFSDFSDFCYFDTVGLSVVDFEHQYFDNLEASVDNHHLLYNKYTKMIIIDDKYIANINDMEIDPMYENDIVDKEKTFIDLIFTSHFTINKYIYTSNEYCKINVSNDAFNIFMIIFTNLDDVLKETESLLYTSRRLL